MDLPASIAAVFLFSSPSSIPMQHSFFVLFFFHLSVCLCVNTCKSYAIVFEMAARGTQVFHVNRTYSATGASTISGNLTLRRQSTAREFQPEKISIALFLLDIEIILTLIHRWRQNKLLDGCPFPPHFYLYPGSTGDAVSYAAFLLIFHQMWSEPCGMDGKSITLNIYVMVNDMLKTGGLSLAAFAE